MNKINEKEKDVVWIKTCLMYYIHLLKISFCNINLCVINMSKFFKNHNKIFRAYLSVNF